PRSVHLAYYSDATGPRGDGRFSSARQYRVLAFRSTPASVAPHAESRRRPRRHRRRFALLRLDWRSHLVRRPASSPGLHPRDLAPKSWHHWLHRRAPRKIPPTPRLASTRAVKLT